METKKEIRSRLKKQRSLLGVDECGSMSHEIYKRLIALELDREYDNILLYSAIRNEVNTDEYVLIDNCTSDEGGELKTIFEGCVKVLNSALVSKGSYV
jgi:5-formyltetrahydrofolate cyclo-ligase